MELGERIAVVESKIIEVIKVNDKQNEYLVTISGMLHEINTKLDKQKGFMGGVTFVITSLVAIASVIIQFVSGHRAT